MRQKTTMRNKTCHILFMIVIMALCSCFNDKSKTPGAMPHSSVEGFAKSGVDSALLARQRDSVSFEAKHCYGRNYNFIVNTDTLRLHYQQPEEIVSRYRFPDELTVPIDTDSVKMYYGEPLVVAEIRIMPADTIDSVWVQVARDQYTFGWIRESELLPAVVPDDPISQFISFFSNTHILWMLIAVGSIVVAYVLRIISRKRANIIHFNDIPSFYPTLLVLTLALAATVYSTIQMFMPEMWRYYYYHPTLNPFDVPLFLGLFLSLVWLLPVIGLATIDDVRRHLPFEDALLYLCGLVAVCMVVYVVFSVTTLYYIGYVLLALYVYYSIRTFYRHRRLVYYCGNCGKAMHSKGRCPHCDAMNI